MGLPATRRLLLVLLLLLALARPYLAQRHRSSYRSRNPRVCTSNEFICRNGQCIDSTKYCNGVQDCHDGSDEHNCSCREDQFECVPGYCLSLSRRCDGIRDCVNGMDEQNCRNMSTNYQYLLQRAPTRSNQHSCEPCERRKLARVTLGATWITRGTCAAFAAILIEQQEYERSRAI